jgi:pimeloyl-ACP methyl ester carboxylesterase
LLVAILILTLLAPFAGFVVRGQALVSSEEAPLLAKSETLSEPMAWHAPRAIVIGFMGGNVGATDPTRNELIIAKRLRESYRQGMDFEVYENRRLEDAHQRILQLLGATNVHAFSATEKNATRIILYGHSWGASAAVTLAQELQRDGVPVALTVQVDSVQKKGQDDGLIPGNVAQAVNFYQPDGWLHGRTEIRAADPARTQILGNFRVNYQAAPAECRPYPWYERAFIKTHIAIECDPKLWNRIEGMIRDALGQPVNETAAAH